MRLFGAVGQRPRAGTLHQQGEFRPRRLRRDRSLRDGERPAFRLLRPPDLARKPVPAECGQPQGRRRDRAVHAGNGEAAGLNNSFDAVEALGKSAEYLNELKSRYGNLGFAAAAYNAGENGLERFLEVDWLPAETRNYVLAITAYSVEDWRDNPPKILDLTLDKNKTFLDGCVALASTRNLRDIEVIDEAEWAPWGVQLAAHFQKSVAQRLFVNAVKRLPESIRSEKPLLLRERNASFGLRIRYAARIGRETQAEANKLCTTIRKSGGACLVFKN